MLIPIIKVFDRHFGREHIVGTDTHDQLLVDEEGRITYHNLQNGDGTGTDSAYEFVAVNDGPWKSIEFAEEIDGHVLVDKQWLESLEDVARAAKALVDEFDEDAGSRNPYNRGRSLTKLRVAIRGMEAMDK